MKLIGFLLLFFLLLACEKVDPEIKKEFDKSKQEILKIESKINTLSNELLTHKNFNKEEKDKINQNNLIYLNTHVKLYELINKTKPDTNKLKQIIPIVPNEIYSMTNKIYYKKNFKGGWYYDINKNEFYINSKL